ncbi:MAG: IPTL-CTERM sorting domain-containing protein, partial [Vicinamibacterales bacterium]|nr:IPTL-CTERM sorting domain-containing protein [Vicinamibacterales bacterium]
TAAGVLAGTPTAAGTSTFTIRGTDANGCFAELPYTILVVTAVPTLPEWGFLVLATALPALGYVMLRRRRIGLRQSR